MTVGYVSTRLVAIVQQLLPFILIATIATWMIVPVNVSDSARDTFGATYSTRVLSYRLGALI